MRSDSKLFAAAKFFKTFSCTHLLEFSFLNLENLSLVKKCTWRLVCKARNYLSHLHSIFLRFCRTWTKRYLITSQTRVKRLSRIHHQTILTRLWPMMHLHPRCLDHPLGPSFRSEKEKDVQNLTKSQKRLFELAVRNRLSLSLPLSFSFSSNFFSFSKQKMSTS